GVSPQDERATTAHSRDMPASREPRRHPCPAPRTDPHRDRIQARRTTRTGPDGSPIPPAPPEGTARAEETPLPGPAHHPAPRPNPVPQDDTDRPVPRPADRYGSGPVDPDCYPPRERTG
ncbi:hypothetical protein ABT011_31295, partial [Streptomyces virginiae]